MLSPHILGGPHTKHEEDGSVISIGGIKVIHILFETNYNNNQEHEGEVEGGDNHPAHGPEAAWGNNTQ